MITVETLAQLDTELMLARKRAIMEPIIDELRRKPGLELDDVILAGERANKSTATSTSAFSYLGVKISVSWSYGSFQAHFPYVAYKKRGRLGYSYTTYGSSNVKTAKTTDELYEGIIKCHKRYLSLLRKKEKQEEAKKATA